MPEITALNPETLAKPASPFSKVVRVKASEFIFIAGMGPIDKDGNIIGAGDIEVQARQVFANIEAGLKSVGAGWGNVVQFTTFLRDSDDIAKLAKFRIQHFPGMFPNGVYPTNTLVLASRFSHESYRLEVQTMAAL
jgi:enamine deaminase RidA (YjgF/YER057c/UK114 family)